MRQCNVFVGQGWRLTTLLFLATLSLVLASCSSGAGSSSDSSNRTEVALFGDSLSWEAQSYYRELIHSYKEVALTYDSYGGTAVCDWFSKMHQVESKYHPKFVELQFSGNNLTPCMEGVELYSPEYYEKYRADTLTAISIFARNGTRVYLIGAPITRAQQSVPQWQTLNVQYEDIAAADLEHVSYVDAGTAVEGPGHTYTDTLPCLAHESCDGPVVNGMASNVVRSPDGVHFCPNEEGNDAGVIAGCSVYSSGAYRFAQAMVQALEV